ncbi:MAG: FAD binding domain-containing protein [Stellaceae bacterium]
MKLPAFEYACPSSIDEAIALLDAHEGARAIAGGQSLVPILAFRLARPPLLVDLRKLPELDRIAIDGYGVRIGAKVRWREILDDQRLRAAQPLLVAAIAHVAHYQIRNRGTIGGSLAHADPAAELPGIAATCDAEIAVRGKSGNRTVRTADFFLGPLTTVLAPHELVTELRFPAWPSRRRWGFDEFALRRGDFALAGVALFFDLDARGRAHNAHIGALGAVSRPRRLSEAEAALNGRVVDEATIAETAAAAARAVDPSDDLHASAAYRRALVETLVERTLRRAVAAR